MKISYHKKFVKQYSKQTSQIKEKFIERQDLFVSDHFHPLLGNHLLNGEWVGCRSINITGDVRAIFEEIDSEHIEFVAIGNHSELYS